LNVTSCPALSTAVHWLPDRHATPVKPPPVSTVTGVGVPGERGLNVTSCPTLSTAVQRLDDGHATPLSRRPPFWSIAIGADHDSDACATPVDPRNQLTN
jgi:hypothetical protein